MKPLPCKDFIEQCFRYEEGRLFWKTRPRDHFKKEYAQKAWNTAFSGREAGVINKNRSGDRWVVTIGNVPYYRSRIVWTMHNGSPLSLVDHINRDTTDDRIENLREATVSQNAANKKRSASNQCGHKGVRNRGCPEAWHAAIEIKGKSLFLGSFPSPEEANMAYMVAAIEHFGEYANAG